jgi:enoyl-CoA hydratase/carnithine racemase
MCHELHLVAPIRVASADVQYAADENAHGRVPGIAAVRFCREAGWANATRYAYRHHWGAQTAYRMGFLQKVLRTGTRLSKLEST